MIRSAGGSDESFYFCVVFFSRRAFDAAGNVHAKRTDLADGVRDIFRGQAAGQENGLAEFLGFHGQIPIEFLAGAAERRRRKGIEQIRIGLVLGDFFKRHGTANAEGFHGHEAELRTEFGRFVAVELEHGQAAFPDGMQDKVRGSIHENSHAQDKRGQLPGDFRRRLKWNEARTFLVKVETQSVRARSDRDPRIGKIRNAADFYLCAHL